MSSFKKGNLHIFKDKWQKYQLFKKYYKRDVISLADVNFTDSVFEQFVNLHPLFIAKPQSDAKGKGVSLINSLDYDSKSSLLGYLLSKRLLICEELINQVGVVKMVHPHSVNTVRMVTVIDKNKNVVIFYPRFRMGRGNSVVDNAGAGGIMAEIDSASGKIITDGIDDFCHRYTYHPDSNISLMGLEMPEWNKAIDLAKELALVCPSNRYIGWNLAYSDKGWVVVEGNARGQFGVQYCDRIGRKKEIEELI